MSETTGGRGDKSPNELERPPYHRRLTPLEPYRYECPNCGSVDIRANVNNGKPGSTTAHDAHCHACYRPIDPIDRKEAAHA